MAAVSRDITDSRSQRGTYCGTIAVVSQSGKLPGPGRQTAPDLKTLNTLGATDSIEIQPDEPAWRIIRSTNLIRLLIAAALLAVFFGLSSPPVVGARLPIVFGATTFAYLAYALLMIPLTRGRWLPVRVQIYQQVVVDIVVLIVLMHASGGISSGLGGLLIIFVAAALLTRPKESPYFIPALAVIGILAEQAFSQWAGTTAASQFTASGLLGAMIFLIPLISGPLAKRLSDSEALLEQRGVDLANLSRLNQYIVQHLRESIVALDGNDRIRLINESAAKLLGCRQDVVELHLTAVSPILANRISEWRARTFPAQGQDIRMTSGDGSSVLNINVAPMTHDGDGPPPLLIFIEDTSLLAERVQQSKLASLGRLSASIAHEIRNPVGAMSHAGQLLSESVADNQGQQRLVDIIVSHSARVSTIIENILQLSRRDTGARERLRLQPWLHLFAKEFLETLALNEGELAIAPTDEDLEVLIDTSHLRQVLWNICENAVKYASDSGGINVELTAGRVAPSGRPYLDIADRGAGITSEMAEHIFEPFFTAREGGTGLGLFISRELCELNRAALSYRPRPGGGSVFRIVFSDPERWGVEGQVHE